MSAPLKWEVTNTGGGCMAFRAERAGFYYLITAHGDPSLPAPQESADLGIYNADDDAAYFGTFNNSLAAANYAECWTPPTLRTWLEKRNTYAKPNGTRWINAFDQSRHGSTALLDCPEDSVCGIAIKRTLEAADVLLNTMNDATYRERVISAVRGQANVIYFG